MKDINDVNRYRKKRRKKKHFKRLIIFLLVIALGFVVYLARDTIADSFRDAGSILIESGESGFPVSLPGSAGYSFKSMGNNFTLLTDTYFYSYSTNGQNLLSYQHGYNFPVIETNSKRALIYDKGGNKFSLVNKSSVIYESSLDEVIVYGAISNGDMVAIVTDSDRYSCIMRIFNGSGEEIFSWKSVDNKIMQIVFDENEHGAFVTMFSAIGGEIYTRINSFDFNTDYTLWETSIAGTMPLAINRYGNDLILTGDSKYVILSKDDGSVRTQYVYAKNLRYYSVSKGLSVLAMSNGTSNLINLVSVNDTCEILGSINLSGEIYQIFVSDKIYILVAGGILCYNKTFELLDEFNLEGDISDFIVINSKAYLLGYDEVNIIDLK